MAAQVVGSYLDGAFVVSFEVNTSGVVTGVTGVNTTPDRSITVTVSKHSTGQSTLTRTFAPGDAVTVSIQKNRQFDYAGSAPDWTLGVAFA